MLLAQCYSLLWQRLKRKNLESVPSPNYQRNGEGEHTQQSNPTQSQNIHNLMSKLNDYNLQS